MWLAAAGKSIFCSYTRVRQVKLNRFYAAAPALYLRNPNSYEPTPEAAGTSSDPTAEAWLKQNCSIVLHKLSKEPFLALAFFNQLKGIGFVHDVSSWAAMIRILCSCSLDRKLDSILDDVVKRSRGEQLGFELFNLLQVVAGHDGGCHAVSKVLDVLVKRLASLEMFDEALDVLVRVDKDLRVMPSVKTVNFLMQCLIDSNQDGAAVEIYQQLETCFGLKPDDDTYGIVVKALCKTGMLEEANELLLEMDKLGFVPDVYVYGMVIDKLCRVGKIHEATSIHEGMLSNGVKTNCKLVGSLLQGLSYANIDGKVESFFETCKSRGVYLDKVCYNIAMKAYCKFGKAEEATALLTEMKDNKHMSPDLVNYTTLIDGYCGEDRLEEAWSFFIEMKRNGIKPDLIVYNVLASGFSRSGDAAETRRLLDMMKKDDEIEPTSDTYCIIIEGLCKAEKLDDAEGFYSEYLEKDGSSLDICNAMVNGYCSAKSVEKAFELFLSVSKQGRILKKKTCLKLLSMLVDEDDKCLQLVETVLNLEADYAYVLCRRAIFMLSRAGKMEMAAFVLLRLNRSIDVATYTMMIQGYCGVKRLREAEEDLNEMKIRGVDDELGEAEEVLNEMKNQGAERLLEGAFKVLKEMKNRGVKPDIVTYTSLLDGLLKRYPEGKKKEEFKNDIIREIEEKEVEPDAVYYTVLIDGSGRAGYIERASATVPPPKHIERAKEHFKEMVDSGLEPDIVAYTALFFGLLRAGDVQSVRDLGNKMSDQLTLDSSFYEVLKYGSGKAAKNC